MKLIGASVLSLLSLGAFALTEREALSQRGANPEFVAAVKRGEFRRARASWWGFDAADSTASLQAAIDSGVPGLVIDALPEPWVVTPLRVSGNNRKIVFEKGATIVAKPGAFCGQRDFLLDVNGVTNLLLRGAGTLRMRRDDYTKPPYERSEWRYALAVHNSRGVRIEGLTVAESGGDGLCIWGRSGDVSVRNCTFDRNFRQGISVADVENLTIENCILSNTAGTAPAAGIDLEPDRATEKLVNVVIRNCQMKGNQGSGIQICLNQLRKSGAPVSVLVEDCKTEGNANGTGVILTTTGEPVLGEVRFRRVVFSNEKGAGIGFENKPANALRFVFENCRIENACTQGDGNRPDVQFYPPHWDDALPDQVVFDGLQVVQPKPRPWLGLVRESFGTRPKSFTGRVTVSAPGQAKETISLDEAYFARLMPLPEGDRPLPRHEIDFRETKVVDRAPGRMVELTPLAVTGFFRYIFYADQARQIHLRGRQVKHRPDGVVDRGQMMFVQGVHRQYFHKVPEPLGEETDVVFPVPAGGWYVLRVFPSIPFGLTAADVPIALDLTQGAVVARLADLGKPAHVWFDLPDRRLPFSFVLGGGGAQNRLKARLVDAAGTELFLRDRIQNWTVCPVLGGGAPGLADLELSRAKDSAFYYFRLDVTGLPSYLLLSNEKYWHWNGHHRDPSRRIP